MDVFEICIPYLSMSNRKTMLVDKVYGQTREEVDMFIKQHNLRVYDVNVVDVESLSSHSCSSFSISSAKYSSPLPTLSFSFLPVAFVHSTYEPLCNVPAYTLKNANLPTNGSAMILNAIAVNGSESDG